MRRALIRAVGALVLVTGGALGGLTVSQNTAPRKLREAVESSLAEAFGAPVEVRSVRLRLFPGIAIEASGISAWPGPAGPAFQANGLTASLDVATLPSGRLRFSSIAFAGADLRLERAADGTWTPPLLTPGFENPIDVLHRLFAADLPAPTLDVRSGRLTVIDHGLPAAAKGAQHFTVSELQLRLLAPALLESGRLVLSGILEETEGTSTPFELESVAAGRERPDFALAARDLSLARFGPYLQDLDPSLALTGRVSGVLDLSPLPDAATEMALDLVANDLRARSERLGAGPPLEIAHFGIETTLAIEGAALRLPAASLRTEAFALSLSGGITRPLESDSGMTISARLADLDLTGVRALAALLPEGARTSFEGALANVASGHLRDIALDAASTPGAVAEVWERGTGLLPAGVVVSTRVEDLVLRATEDAPLTVKRGTARIEAPDTLLLGQFEGTFGDRPLPILDLRLHGLANLLGAPGARVPDAPPLPGRHALEQLLLPVSPDGATSPAWLSLDVDADWIQHPAFFRPLHRVSARLAPTPDGVSLRVTRASWGGIPITGEGRFTRGPIERLRMEVSAGPAAEAPALIPGTQAHGHFVLVRPTSPGLGVTTLRSGFDLAGTRLTLFDSAAELGIPGRLTGDARLDLGTEGEVLASFRILWQDVEAKDLLAAISDDPTRASGRVEISARLEGPMRPERPLLHTLAGDVRITARDGVLAVDLPILFALAKASTTFNPFGSANDIRYDEMDADLALADGILTTKRSIALESPDLRLVLSGQLDLRETPRTLEAVVGVFFFRPLDQVIGAIPVLSRIVLGPDRSLFGTYFELTGPWQDPRAGLLPMKTFALGPASFLMEGVPSFVKQGVEAIQRVLPGLGPKPPAVASPAESADPQGDGS